MEKYSYIIYSNIGHEIDRGHINLPARPMKGEVVMVENQRCRINDVVHSADGVTLELLFD